MLFNSWQFFIFFLIVYALYLIFNHKWQNRLLLLASCIFYGTWSWKFLCLMFVSITTDYVCGIKIYNAVNEKKRKIFLFISMFVNLFILGFFKYLNFFSSNMQDLLKLLGCDIHIMVLNIVLPVGISFYTFQAMSYALDIYRKKLEPAKSYFDYALFVTYFPQLVAGPIMRAGDLLPQVLCPRKLRLDWFYEGGYLIFWGLFQKVFIADNLAKIVDSVFFIKPPYNGVIVLLGLYAFAFQIYCDFSGYSNIARGIGRLMGFDIMFNFNLPYFSTNPREFWQRWHISLSTWLRDYLYIPLGGNRKGIFMSYVNILITMLLGGIWHGAAWTFVIWGIYQGVLLMLYKISAPIFRTINVIKNSVIGKIWFFIKVVILFHFMCLGWLIFRASSMAQVYQMLQAIFFNFTYGGDIHIIQLVIQLIFFTGLLIIVETFQFSRKDLMCILKTNCVLKILFYIICYCLIVIFGVTSGKEFIYFQF